LKEKTHSHSPETSKTQAFDATAMQANSVAAPGNNINFTLQKKEHKTTTPVSQLYAGIGKGMSGIQTKSHAAPDTGINFTIQKKENKTGLPDQLKSGIENLSGHAMDDVKVHYNSSQPAQLNAHAYAQGNQIHIAPGQDKHLAHEAWHVVQQKQGRVKPTKQLKSSVAINDDAGLEKEADMMGAKALNQHIVKTDKQSIQKKKMATPSPGNNKPIQRLSFFVNGNRVKTEDMTYVELKQLLSEMKQNKDEAAIQSLKDACTREIKKLTKGSKVSTSELVELLKEIDEVPEPKQKPIITTEDTSKALASHAYKKLAEDIGILNNNKINFWIHKDTPLPESNVRGEIAEELTQDILVKANKGKTVLSSVKIVTDNGPHAQYRYTELADIDHLVLLQTEHGYVPQEIFETKAGAEGDKTGALKTALSNKLKILKSVVANSYKIMYKDRDITSMFYLDILKDSEVKLFTSGIFDNTIKLNEVDIEGVWNYLKIVQEHYIAYKREW